MATDTVNGMDYNQYGQPAELAASTPSQNLNAAATQGQKPETDPQEIGWYFVEQYYTTLSKSPDKIHLFYNKKSQLITGTEAEKVLPSVGSKAISEKIKSLDISDCKIRVLNVDCQASYDNIVVQVIGEMSNKNQPHHKFVQTFILATQPNGYFVLNDIFRYLNQDEDEIVEDEPSQEEAAPVPEADPEPEPVSTPAAANEIVNTESAVEQVDEKLEAAAEDEPTSTETHEDVNGVAEASIADATETTETTETTEPTDSAEPAEPTEPVEPDDEPEVSVPAPEPEPAAEEPLAPEPTRAQSPSQAASVSDGPSTKKTWASMVGTKAPALPALPQTQAPSTTATTTAAPTQSKSQRTVQPSQPKAPSESVADSTETPTSQSNGWQEAGKKTRQQSKAQEGIVHAYIKNVNDKIDARVLREVLEKFGKLKYYDVSRPKQCAFVEFEDPAGYAAAVAENPHTVGSEQINVEERRPRPGTTGSFNGTYARGGANAARGRGAPQQRSGSQGAAFSREGAPRGNLQGQRGSKATGAARGRGQPQAA